MRNTLNEEKLKDKFEGGDKEKIESAVQETLDWLDKNQLAEKDEFEAKQKELEGIVNPHHDEGLPGGRRWWHARGWHAWWRHGRSPPGAPAARPLRRLTKPEAMHSAKQALVRNAFSLACLAI